jgi:hypothetical protein
VSLKVKAKGDYDMKKVIKQVDVKVDFDKKYGKFKPMHGIGQPPMTGLSNSMFHYLKEAGIPYSRLHDVGGCFEIELFDLR